MSKSLKELQDEVVAKREAWGFSGDTLERLLVNFASETGELIGAAAKEHLYGKARVPDEDRSSVMHELADLLVYMFAIANAVGVDMERALESKIRLNDKRFAKK